MQHAVTSEPCTPAVHALPVSMPQALCLFVAHTGAQKAWGDCSSATHAQTAIMPAYELRLIRLTIHPYAHAEPPSCAALMQLCTS